LYHLYEMEPTLPATRKKTAGKKKPIANSFPVVAIGASAGGLEAVSLLLQNLTADTGMAFIYVQHLNRDHKSMLTTLLARSTKMKVQKIENMELIKPNNVYVIPHNKGIEVTDGHIQLLPRPTDISTNLSIDILFSSLAKTHKANVIGIILSGNASDGTKGLKAIKKAGGLTFAQDETAKYGSMPASAISEGVADYVLSPKEIAKKLIAISKKETTGSFDDQEAEEDKIYDSNPDLSIIFGILNKSKGVDFSHYKLSTIKRRIQRRVLKNNVKSTKEYARLLSGDKGETETLYTDLLINVTGFFRDMETFRYLKSTLIPKLLKDKKKSEILRIWVAACSTGQEAYSIAMLISEIQEKHPNKIPVQIFATDLSEQVIQTARLGEYSKADLKSVSQARLNKFFTKSKSKFKINQALREMCVFGTSHNILRDPPFSRMDFISCRNLLIYFDPPAQKKVLSTLHFSLNDKGYLMLGKSESIGSASTHFAHVNNKFKIYSRKKNAGIRKMLQLTPRYPKTIVPEKNIRPSHSKNNDTNSIKLDGLINSILLARYMPACAIINKDMEILQFRGSTSMFLVHPSGKASLNILKMIRPEFAFELRNAILEVIKTKQSVSKTGIEVKINSHYQMMTLDVSPIKFDWDEPLLLVVFTLQEQENYTEKDKAGKNGSLQKDERIKRLSDELNHARTEIHSVIELQETAYEELQTANEEIVSSNEEFQTLNEELESTKEEIEAANEELIATNTELRKHNNLLEESYTYSQTIIATIHEPMIVLDSNLQVKSANKSFYKKFNVNKEETEGKGLFELGNRQWDIPKLHELLESILSKNSYFENFEVAHTFPGMGEKVMLLNASRIIQKTHREKLILLAIKDITERVARQKAADGKIKKDILGHQLDKLYLEKEVKGRTKELEQKNIELETANKDLVSFTYISSHDLQEPLRKIQNFASSIQKNEEKNLSDSGKKYLGRMIHTANRMRFLIEDLLSYSRTKSDDRVFESIDVTFLINEVKNDFEDVIQDKNAVIEATDLCKVEVIPFQFRQLFHNLISNSLKFAKPEVPTHIIIKSRIGLGSTLKEERLLPEKKYCHIVFTDNGIGFEPQYNNRIFEVFQRLHAVHEFPGTGIGLAICKRIVENHNGYITATGELNKGARFDIYIPSENLN
jgi:two-component system, chemotaxis family, CheB/CheR fusion protein